MKNSSEALSFVEELFVKYGAESVGDLDEKARKAFGLRQAYRHGNEYYRVDEAEIEGKPYVVISTTDVEQYAAMSVMDDIAIFPADASREEMEAQVRAAFGIEG